MPYLDLSKIGHRLFSIVEPKLYNVLECDACTKLHVPT